MGGTRNSGQLIEARSFRRHLAAALLAVVVGVGAAAWPATSSAATRSDWPQEGHDGGRRSWNPDEMSLTKANTARLAKSWSVAGTTAVVAAGRLYVAGTSSSNRATVTAVHATTGKRLWRRTFDDERASSLAVADGRIFVAGYTRVDACDGCWSGHVSALNAATGDLQWTAIGGGELYVAGHAVVASYFDRFGMYAYLTVLDGATGRVSAMFSLGRTMCGSSDLVVQGGVVYLAGCGGTEAANLDGTFRAGWQPNPIAEGFSPIATRDRLYVAGYGGGITAANLQTGAREFQVPSAWSRAIAVDGVRVFGFNEIVPGTSGIFELFAVDRATGKALWRHTAPAPQGAAVANGVLVLAADALIAYDAATGARLWKHRDEGAYRDVVIANGMVYATRSRPTAAGSVDEIVAFALSSR